MTTKFDYFVILAAMRTGSNLLEANLSAIDGISCYGEAFNPGFLGRVNWDEMLGVSLEQRDNDPLALLEALRTTPGDLNGFRYFKDHDPRVLEPVLNDPRCAKIILSRNPLDSYLSLKIARKTKQWQLKNIKRRLDAQVAFDADAFAEYLDQTQSYYADLSRRLQKIGQTAFYVTYDDLKQLDVLNGLASWLGVSARLDCLDETLKRQNPAPALSKVTNPEEMEASLSKLDGFALSRAPNFGGVQSIARVRCLTAPTTSLMFLPIGGAPDARIGQWLAALDGAKPGDLDTGQPLKQARAWMQAHPGHRKFTVLRHPLARAHTAFCTHILSTGPDSYPVIRKTLRNSFKLPIPGQVREKNYSKSQHYQAFAAFLTFLRHNFDGQTPIRVDPSWCSQTQSLRQISDFATPDLVFREEDLSSALPDLARTLGHSNPPPLQDRDADTPFTLSQIYDAQLESLAAEAYRNDYEQFGFDKWRCTEQDLRGAV